MTTCDMFHIFCQSRHDPQLFQNRCRNGTLRDNLPCFVKMGWILPLYLVRRRPSFRRIAPFVITTKLPLPPRMTLLNFSFTYALEDTKFAGKDQLIATTYPRNFSHAVFVYLPLSILFTFLAGISGSAARPTQLSGYETDLELRGFQIP